MKSKHYTTIIMDDLVEDLPKNHANAIENWIKNSPAIRRISLPRGYAKTTFTAADAFRWFQFQNQSSGERAVKSILREIKDDRPD